MIQCSNCRNHELTGALFCSECGSQLAFGQEDLPAVVSDAQAMVSSRSNAKNLPGPPAVLHAIASLGGPVSLHLLDSGEMIPLAANPETTLGRAGPGQPIVPDLDLSPYAAYEAGVSRLHASIQISEAGIMVIDLGSANGTRLNGQKLAAHTPHVIQNGDALTLGKFRMQVVIQS
jgi:hypothetical protein